MLELLQSCGEMAVVLMGGSFVFGSLFTIFVLLVLEFIKRNQKDYNPEKN